MAAMTLTATEDLRGALRGELIEPSSEGYAEACKLYNGMIHKRPALIARCADIADVMAAVDWARDTDALLAIRGGGHNGGGLGSCDDGLVIDLSRLRDVRVDPATRTVRVGAGCRWGDVDHAAHPFGLAVPTGIISTTGVAGLTLGGGHGYLTRKYGLTIDNLLAADVVLADGSFVTASADDNADLFWALRGGGGNFGVVTSCLFRAHPVRTAFAGPTFWPIEQATEVMQWFREFSVRAPEDLYCFFAFLTIPPAAPFPEELHGRNACGVVWAYTGPSEGAEEAIHPALEVGTPLFHGVQELPWPVVQSMFDPLYPSGLQWYWRGDFVRELPDEAIARHVEFGSALPTPLSTMHIYPIDGAASRIGADETAFAHRDALWSSVFVGVDPDPANAERISAWTKAYWSALHPFSAGGAYVNFMMEEGQERVRATYRGNYDRLAAIKRRYDPTNLFRVNQNIAPAD